mmetsp:Transcript_31350/g.66735  ORF Transcript_31350/g.66735 Transcript_31350/m.66735 type:complete len:644 (-) Transcript_31350:297-2228(-)|eukprot:CAMPEP_0172553568 /NCGR_PEP_ID=MMETSP1067-20121228/51279_1 /TAXON_ID=265564 ORGANISM="Thalassiosira punctigera, Strain Tpunct2005C2" /NCGR_SAMPLE_ID=MMETSP1067 /ASSEMBLY_ACC=CAM_ASM_000444 /LENGTH=643 /DNA_ID=CAMNT_0013341777 /DNA_START=174 /DNA_END=2105 /DNA_ORIENTATION=-
MTNLSLLSIICLMMEGNHALLFPSHRRPSQYRRAFGSTAGALSARPPSAAASDQQEPPRRVKIRARAATKGSGGGGSKAATLRRTKRRSEAVAKSSGKKKGRRKDEKGAAAGDEEEPLEKYYSHKPTAHTVSGAPWQHQEMMDHTILTKEEEIIYGRQVVRARELREKIDTLLEERRVEKEMRRLEREEMEMREEGGGNDEMVDYDFLSYELEYLSVYGYRPSRETSSGQDREAFDLEDELLIEHAQHRSHHVSQLRTEPSSNFVGEDGGPRRTGYRNGSTSQGNAQRNSYSSLLHVPLHRLSESDAVEALGILGGRAQLTDILLEGAYAREVLMRRNVKLVMSIAKNWMRNSFSTANANLGGLAGSGGSSTAKRGGRSTKRFLSQMYEGSWDRPSLDEAVQEGTLGLARAVDKYDPERGLRFSTYATHWITSYVRVCFQRAATGCLRVPSQLHDIKAAYSRIVRDHLHLGSDPPGRESIAKELGISEQRLRTAIRATGTLLSVDAPVMGAGGGGSHKGSMAGGDGSNSQELLILDTLKCAEPKPEDHVEISFLRQCLENAMASELTPHERDVLRLRLGLDSGEGRTVRQIVDMSGGSVSMSDIRSTERRAFKKLRSPTSVHTHNLLMYLDLAGVDVDATLRR